MTTCGTCKQDVDKDEHRDAHNLKTCPGCTQKLPIERFPLWPSAGDGRRATCDTCSSSIRSDQEGQRAKSRVTARETRNARFQKHGYRWVLSENPGFHGSKWILLDANGVPAEIEEAEARIRQQEYDEEGPLDYHCDGYPY